MPSIEDLVRNDDDPNKFYVKLENYRFGSFDNPAEAVLAAEFFLNLLKTIFPNSEVFNKYDTPSMSEGTRNELQSKLKEHGFRSDNFFLNSYLIEAANKELDPESRKDALKEIFDLCSAFAKKAASTEYKALMGGNVTGSSSERSTPNTVEDTDCSDNDGVSNTKKRTRRL